MLLISIIALFKPALPCMVDLIVSHTHDAASYFATQFQLCSELHATQRIRRVLEDFAKSQLSPDLLSSACERRASNWLSCLPLKFYGFTLHKTAFRDAVMLRYHCTPPACPMMSEVCSNVSTEPHLQPLTDKALRFQTANSDSNAQCTTSY